MSECKQGMPTSSELQELQSKMLDIATRLNYYGGMTSWARHGLELSNAAGILMTWIDAAKEQEAKND